MSVQENPTLFIGDRRMDLESLQKDVGPSVDLKFHPSAKSDGSIRWCRDETVRKFDGTHVIGPALQTSEGMLAEDMVPPGNARHFGHGLNTFSVLEYRSDRLKLEISRQVFEGGNVHLFKDAENVHRALIGFNLVVASIAKYQEDLSPAKEASDEAYFLARNFDYHKDFVGKYDDKESLATYDKALKGPLLAEEKEFYHKSALKMEAQIQKVKELYASALGVENPVFLPHSQLHIDMEYFPVEGTNKVLLDEGSRGADLLAKAGLEPVKVKGITKVDDKVCNLMNIVKLPEHRVIMAKTDPQFEEMDSAFVKKLNELGLEVIRVGLPEDTITKLNGGFRCMTMWK